MSGRVSAGEPGGAAGAPPPSAAGHIEPYGARIWLGPAPAGFAPGAFLKDLLERVAGDCIDEGATIVGHLKCVLVTEAGRIRCNLTSLRSGATCVEESPAVPATTGPAAAAPAAAASAMTMPAAPGPAAAGPAIAGQGGAALDLAVLVYGLPAETVDRLVGDALVTLLGPPGVAWGKHAEFQGHRESC